MATFKIKSGIVTPLQNLESKSPNLTIPYPVLSYVSIEHLETQPLFKIVARNPRNLAKVIPVYELELRIQLMFCCKVTHGK